MKFSKRQKNGKEREEHDMFEYSIWINKIAYGKMFNSL